MSDVFLIISTILSKRIAIVMLLFLLNLFYVQAQQQLRISVDNDFLAFRKEDGAYTNGIRLDYFYSPRSKKSIPPIFIRTGDGSKITSGFGIMQMMITPNNIREVTPSKDDYPYSGSLFGIISLNSINKHKTKSITTQYVSGLIGPGSLADKTQIGFHQLGGFDRPVGWATQYKGIVFVNLNISAENLILSKGFLEFILGAELQVGTMMNSARLQSIVRIGKMNPYFEGIFKRFISYGSGKHINAYLSIKPYAQVVGHNALLEGTVFNAQIYEISESIPFIGKQRIISPWILGGEAELVMIYHSFGISVAYKGSTGHLQNQPFKVYGNISLCWSF